MIAAVEVTAITAAVLAAFWSRLSAPYSRGRHCAPHGRATHTPAGWDTTTRPLPLPSRSR